MSNDAFCTRMVVPIVIVFVTACAAGAGVPAPSSPGKRGDFTEGNEGDMSALARAPWSAAAAAGGPTYVNSDVGLRLAARTQGIERQKVVVYQASPADVGFHYQGVLDVNRSRCPATISVYVYPAVPNEDEHFRGVVEAVRVRNPEAVPGAALVDLTPAHGGPIRQAGFKNRVKDEDVDELVSVSRRGAWFVKYRTTTFPVGAAACRLGLLAFVASLQETKRIGFGIGEAGAERP